MMEEETQDGEVWRCGFLHREWWTLPVQMASKPDWLRVLRAAPRRADPNQSENEGGGSESDGVEFWTSP